MAKTSTVKLLVEGNSICYGQNAVTSKEPLLNPSTDKLSTSRDTQLARMDPFISLKEPLASANDLLYYYST